MPTCINESGKYYTGNEPSPKGRGLCAGNLPIGTRQIGTDGNLWITKSDKNGVVKWVRLSSQPSIPPSIQKRVSFGGIQPGPTFPQLQQRPSAPPQIKNRYDISQRYEITIKPIVTDANGRRIKKTIRSFPDWKSKVESIARDSLFDIAKVDDLNFKRNNDLVLKVTPDEDGYTGLGYDTFEDFIRDLYGDLADDTWREGDVSIDDRHELDFELIDITPLATVLRPKYGRRY